jgi:hypothetical protein
MNGSLGPEDEWTAEERGMVEQLRALEPGQLVGMKQSGVVTAVTVAEFLAFLTQPTGGERVAHIMKAGLKRKAEQE